MRKKNFDNILLLGLVIFFGLSSSICLAKQLCQAQEPPYTLESKYFSFCAPKHPVVMYEAVDASAPNSKYRKIKFFQESYHHRYYGRISASYGQFSMEGFASNEAGASANVGGAPLSTRIPPNTLTTSKVNGDRFGAEIALGYLWCDVRAEAECILLTKGGSETTATINPISVAGVTTPAVSGALKTQLETQTYLANVYYDFMWGERIRPFLTAGLGMAVNTFTFDTTPLASNLSIGSISKKTYNFAYTAGLGIRLRIFPFCFITTSYRYMSLGGAKAETTPLSITVPGASVNIPSIKAIAQGLNQNTFSIGIMYLF